jgi:Cu/Ag efflux protein CusF
MARLILIILIIAVLVAIAAVATGFIDVSSSGRFKAPDVDVTATGGELPKVDVDTKSVTIESREKTVDVPGPGTVEADVPVVKTGE